MRTFDEIKAMAVLPETTVPLIVGGDKLTEIRELERELSEVPKRTSLGDPNVAAEITARIAALQQEMAGTVVEFRLRALGGKRWGRIEIAKPVMAKDEDPDRYADRMTGWLCRVVAATCIDPEMTEEQVAELSDLLHGGAWDELATTAWTLNTGTVSVPLLQAAFALTEISEAMSRRQLEQESQSASSEAKPARKSRSTSTTTAAA